MRLNFRAFFLAAVLLNCGSGPTGTSTGTPKPTNCGSPGRTGETKAGSCGLCAVGNYCSVDADGFHRCAVGCVSDENCGAVEYCAHCPGVVIGICWRCDSPAPSCEMHHPMMMGCRRDNFWDHDCKDATMTKAYDCSTDSDPPAAANPCKHAVDTLPSLFCCAN